MAEHVTQLATVPPRRIVYLTKLPPSISGIARYASDLLRVLPALGPVCEVNSGGDPQATRTLRSCLRISRQVRRACAEHDADVLMVELSGNAIAEAVATLATLGIRRSRSRPSVWITVHDCPAVTGGLFNLSILQFQGGRRLASLLSRHIGHRLERRLLRSADRVFTFTAAGAAALSERFELARTVETLPLLRQVAETPVAKDDIVFIPGPVRASTTIAVIDAVGRCGPGWRVLVGFGADEEIDRIREHVDAAPSEAVELLGLLEQDALSDAYLRAAIVVKMFEHQSEERAAGNWAACSGPVMDALAAGCVLITNAARGSREVLIDGTNAFDLTGRPDALVETLSKAIAGHELRASIGANAISMMRRANSASAVLARLSGSHGPDVRATPPVRRHVGSAPRTSVPTVHILRLDDPDIDGAADAFEAEVVQHSPATKLVDCDDADMVVFPGAHLVGDWRLNGVRSHPRVRDAWNRLVVYDQRDQPWCWAPGAYTCMPRWGFNDRSQRAVGYQWLRSDEYVTNRDVKPDMLFSFAGSRTHAVRERVLALASHPRGLVFETSPANPTLPGTGYRDALAQAKFVLCPRGHGTATFRAFETLASGRVPVIISDQYVPPDGPVWSQIAVFLPEKGDIDYVRELEEREATFATMSVAAARAYDEHFAEGVRVRLLLDTLWELLDSHGRRSARRDRSDLHYASMEVRHLKRRMMSRAHA